MQRELHVRFGGRAGETHRPRGGRALRSDPYTEHKTEEGKLYLATVIDAYSRRAIGWSITDHMRSELVVDALHMAIWRRRPAAGKTICHSDHGAQYTSWAFGRRLRGQGYWDR
jgi:transposase InsO family protein